MSEQFQDISSLGIDPERQKDLDEFRENEEKVFVTSEDQKTAQKLYDDMGSKYYELRTSMKGKGDQAFGGTLKNTKFKIKPGTIVYRGGVYQEIGQPFEIEIHSIDYNSINSSQLADGSVLYLTDVDALEKVEKSQEEV